MAVIPIEINGDVYLTLQIRPELAVLGLVALVVDDHEQRVARRRKGRDDAQQAE